MFRYKNNDTYQSESDIVENFQTNTTKALITDLDLDFLSDSSYNSKIITNTETVNGEEVTKLVKIDLVVYLKYLTLN